MNPMLRVVVAERFRHRHTMQRFGKYLWIIVLLAGFGLCGPSAAWARDVCAICGRPIQDTIYIVTDEVTNEKKFDFSDCVHLPRLSSAVRPSRKTVCNWQTGVPFASGMPGQRW